MGCSKPHYHIEECTGSHRMSIAGIGIVAGIIGAALVYRWIKENAAVIVNVLMWGAICGFIGITLITTLLIVIRLHRMDKMERERSEQEIGKAPIRVVSIRTYEPPKSAGAIEPVKTSNGTLINGEPVRNN